MATVLHWLAGAKTDHVNDPSACIEPPETPAPVFAVRAFRHALFGTPQTTQRPQPRRHSTNENRPRNVESPRPTRPRMDRPRSANDANALIPAPASPTKGILMTPGTAAAKKKNVTFGDHVVDNQEKRPMKSGLPDDCPGKFPSPFTKTGEGEKDGPADKGRGRSKLTEALEQARDESRQRKGQPDQQSSEESRPGSAAPENDCCAYWRREYDVYRTNTQREVKKLVKKYKAAKDYAQSKDDESSDLRLHLQEAETKADALEEAVNLLTAQIKEMEEKLRSQPQPQVDAETLVPPTRQEKARERPRDLQALLERRGSKERTVSSSTVRTTDNDQLQRPSEPRPTSSRRAEKTGQPQRPSELTSTLDKRKEDPDQTRQPNENVVTIKAAHQAPAAGKNPATITARWAAVKDAPQRPSEPAATSAKPDTDTSEAQTQPKPAHTLVEKAAAPKRSQQTLASATTSDRLSPPPGDLLAPSEPAVYAPPAKPLPPQPTVEDAGDGEASPPPPPRHASGTIAQRTRVQRQDSGLGTGGTLKPMSANARSGSSGGGVGANVGRDGKPIDEGRLEAAKARIRARSGRDVS